MAKSSQIAKVSSKHEKIMLWLLENPTEKLGECARVHGVTQPWLSTIIHSDAFQTRMKELQADYFGEAVLTIKDRANAMTMLALEKLTEKLGVMDNPDVLIKVIETGSTMLGMGKGGLAPGTVAIQDNRIYVANSDDLQKAREAMKGVQEARPNFAAQPTDEELLPTEDQVLDAEVISDSVPEKL